MARSRDFSLTSPYMKGDDIKAFQRLLTEIFVERWEVNWVVEADGVYGPGTRAAARSAYHGYGIAQASLDAHGVTPWARALLSDPSKRNATQKKRGADRAEWRDRLRKSHRSENGLGEAMAAWALTKVGVSEDPPGSNRGPQITRWQEMAGYKGGGVPWCGCFVNAAMVAAGFPTQTWGIGYCPYVESHARAGIDGWVWRDAGSSPYPGWLALFGSGEAKHIEVVVKRGKPLRTVGGNTSKGDGSPNEGGEVAYHDFSTYSGMPLRGYAVPKGVKH